MLGRAGEEGKSDGEETEKKAGNWFSSPWLVPANPFRVTAVRVGTLDFL